MKPLDEQQQKLIDKYLVGRLSEEEEQDFQQQVQQEDFAAEVQFQESLQDAVQKLAKEEHPLKKRFQEEEKKIKEGTAVSTGSRIIKRSSLASRTPRICAADVGGVHAWQGHYQRCACAAMWRASSPSSGSKAIPNP